MNLKIAIITLDEFKNDASSILIKAAVFEKTGTLWVEHEHCYVNLTTSDVIAARGEIMRLIDGLGDCRIAAGPEISGVLYHELDSRGFSIFEIRQCSPDILDEVLTDIEEENASANASDGAVTVPVETGTPGVFFLDLIRLQNIYPELSSKQVLRDFLKNEAYSELRLVCAHVPPWLNKEPYDIAVSDEGCHMTAIIRKRQCEGD